jgi:hypothetical protein
MAEATHHEDRAARSDRVGFLDILGDGFFSGAIGAAVVALFFLALDAIGRVPLYTPSLVSEVVLRGADPNAPVSVDLAMVALFSFLHGAAFVAFGVVCAWVLARLREPPDVPLIALGCFLGLEVGFLVVSSLLAPGLAARIGHGHLAAANVLAAVGMSIWLRSFARHPGE